MSMPQMSIFDICCGDCPKLKTIVSLRTKRTICTMHDKPPPVEVFSDYTIRFVKSEKCVAQMKEHNLYKYVQYLISRSRGIYANKWNVTKNDIMKYVTGSSSE